MRNDESQFSLFVFITAAESPIHPQGVEGINMCIKTLAVCLAVLRSQSGLGQSVF